MLPPLLQPMPNKFSNAEKTSRRATKASLLRNKFHNKRLIVRTTSIVSVGTSSLQNANSACSISCLLLLLNFCGIFNTSSLIFFARQVSLFPANDAASPKIYSKFMNILRSFFINSTQLMLLNCIKPQANRK